MSQGSGVQVQESRTSCIYVALASPKLAAGEELLIWDQLVCFIIVALKLLSTPSYITLEFLTPRADPS